MENNTDTSNSLPVSNDSQKTTQGDNNHTDTVTDQIFPANGTTSEDTRFNSIDHTSVLDGTASEDTNNSDVRFNPDNLSSDQKNAPTENENQNAFDRSVSISDKPSPMDVDVDRAEHIQTDPLSLQKETSDGRTDEQCIDNGLNLTNAPHTNEQFLGSVSFNQQQEESMTISNNNRRVSIKDIDVSLEENNHEEEDVPHKQQFPQFNTNTNTNQGYVQDNIEQMQTGQINDESNQTPQSINNSNEETAPENNVHMASDKPFIDLEGNHLVNGDPAPDNKPPSEVNLNPTISNEPSTTDQEDHTMAVEKAFNQAIDNDLMDNITLDQRVSSQKEDSDLRSRHLTCQFRADKPWLDLQYHDANHQKIKKPNEIENEMDEPPAQINGEILNRIQGSIIGMALGDALGAHVEFRPHQYLVQNPVTDLAGGGTWGLEKGQFTDDTSMALCLANSLVASRGFVPYDQLVRYKWWHESGYMSSTGHCFDIGAATRDSIQEFERRQKRDAEKFNIPVENMDYLSDPEVLKQFNVHCSHDDVAGNGALMRLAPVPLFFYKYPVTAVAFSGYSGQITHGDEKAYDACRYYGALIVAALHGYKKNQLLDKNFYTKHRKLFGQKELHSDIKSIAEGSYQKQKGYDAGIRGKGYIVNALEAALWAFWSDENSFEKGALAAVNLGDDTDTTAAIYGQLAGAYYGYRNLPKHWLNHVYAETFMIKLSKWIVYEGECWQKKQYAVPVCQS